LPQARGCRDLRRSILERGLKSFLTTNHTNQHEIFIFIVSAVTA